MRIFQGIDELSKAVGEHVGDSAWHEIGQEQVDAFAAVTGDHQWIHVDRERAAAGTFGTTIVHGFFTLSLIPLFMAEAYRLEGITMAINYGLDRVRFLAPVSTGSRLRGGFDFIDLTETQRGHLLRAKVTVEVASGDKPAYVADVLTLIVTK